MWSNDIKCKYMFMFPLQNLACKELMNYMYLWQMFESKVGNCRLEHTGYHHNVHLPCMILNTAMFWQGQLSCSTNHVNWCNLHVCQMAEMRHVTVGCQGISCRMCQQLIMINIQAKIWFWWHGLVITSHRILWDVITYPWPQNQIFWHTSQRTDIWDMDK